MALEFDVDFDNGQTMDCDFDEGQAFNVRFNPDGGGEGGAVSSVNGMTGDVVLTASDVGALPSSTVIPSVDNTLSVSGAAADAKKVGDTTGNLANLITTAKNNLVAAINEAAQSGGGGGGAVNSVNGKTGTVVLDAEDVGALPDSTTIPTVDNTLTQAGAAADAKKTGDEISNLKSELGDLSDLETTAKTDLVSAINEVAQSGGGSGLTNDIKQALLQIATKVAYIDNDGRNYYYDLRNALYPPKPATAITLNTDTLSFSELNTAQQLTATLVPIDTSDIVIWTSSDDTVASVNSYGVVTALGYGSATITATAGNVSDTCSVSVVQASLVSISAVYTQSGTVYDTDSVDSLKTDLVVTALYDNQTTATVPSTDYTLSGTLTAGTSTVTVTYENKTTTFTVTVTHAAIDLDTIVYEGKSYRDIFMTANQVQGFDFENGLPSGVAVNAGSPTVSTDDCYSASHSIKCFGSSSQQLKSSNVSGVVDWNRYSGKQYFIAYKGKCTRYVKGWLGINNTMTCPNITSVTNGWETKYKYNTTTSGQSYTSIFMGSGSSADLDGYIDDIVVIPMTDIFTILPTESDMLQFYNDYCDLRKAGES